MSPSGYDSSKNSRSEIKLLRANLSDATHAAAVISLLDHYAQHEMGQSRPLDDDVRARLIPELQAHPGTHVIIALAGDRPVGVAICFLGFSTFKARSLLNIHDFAVHDSARGQGVGQALMEEVVRTARELGCCKVTLEVRVDNHPACKLYQKCGFEPGDPNSTAQWFWTKTLN
jgi:ribosomal protein S18 acetylase RimI-like enzyme